MMRCSVCGTEFEGKYCPNCGTSSDKGREPLYQKWWIYVILGVLVILVIYILGYIINQNHTGTASVSGEQNQQKIVVQNEQTAQPTNNSIAYPSASDINSPPSQLTGQQINAAYKAISYLNSSAFSYNGLIEQLVYEGFTCGDATYGTDHCGANWNEQASKKAKSYLISSAYSYEDLIEQLEYEKFTKEQATYGVDHCEANWNEQAAKAAKSYLRSSSYSIDELIEQLEYDGFTHEQAVYGTEANGY